MRILGFQTLVIKLYYMHILGTQNIILYYMHILGTQIIRLYHMLILGIQNISSKTLLYADSRYSKH